MSQTLRNVLSSPGKNPREWLFLPMSEEWDLETPAVVVETGKPPALDLMAVLPMTEVAELVEHARAQKPAATDAELFEAFLYYCDNDSYIRLA
jgi:hypothetical protein